MAAICLFCPETKLTKEHIWPDWFVREFDNRLGGGRGTIMLVRDGVRVPSWSTNTITLTARLVCAACNNGWMSDIETCAQPALVPLFFGKRLPRAISVEHQCLLAAWIVLRTMVFDAFGPEQKQYFTQSDRIAFKDGPYLAPPQHAHIWLARFRSRNRIASFNVFNQITVTKDDGLHTMSAIINQLAIQVLIWKGTERRLKFAALRLHGWENLTRLMWPSPRRAVQWPPPASLNHERYQTFMNRFRE